MGMTVGITGGIGSGKSTVAGILAGRGWKVIDVDRLAHRVYERPAVRKQIIEMFGHGCFHESRLDRRALAKTVFSELSRLHELNRIVWPPMVELLETRLNELKSSVLKPVAADMAVLFEAGCEVLFDRILVVTAPAEIRMRRIAASRPLNEREIRQRMAGQLDDRIKCEKADYIIENTGTPEALKENTLAFIKWIESG